MPKVKPAALAAAMKDLPPDWEARDVKGRIVFINHSTRTTQWEKPKLSSKKPAKTKVPHASVLAANAAAASAATKARGGGAAPGKGARSAVATKKTSPGATRAEGGATPAGAAAAAGAASRDVLATTSPLPAGWESKIINKKLVYIDHANQKTTFERPTSRTVRGMEVSRGSGRAARGYASAESEQARSQSLRNQTRADIAAYQLSGDDFAEETLGITSGGHARGPANPIYASNASAKQYTSGDSPLPPGWGRSVTANGELYYVNHVKKTTTWTRPQWTGSDDDDEESYDEDTGQPESVRSTRSRRDIQGHAVESAGPPLPPGWEERMSAEGKLFYINHNDKSTHWTRPDPPAVQPDAYPAEDAPSSEITASPQEADLPSASASSTTTPAAEKDLSPEPAGGGDGVAAATSSPSPANGSGAAAGVTASAGGLANGEGVERSAAAAEEEEEEEGEEGEGSAVVVAAAKEEESEPASDKAGKVAVEMEEVAGACSADAVGDPKRAPSATVAGDATAPSARTAERSSSSSPDTSSTTVAERSLGASAKVAGGKEARESSAEEAEAATADDGERGVSAGETAEGGGSGGSVASIVKSGLFGATITRPGGSSSNGSSTKSIPKKSNGGVAPVYASSTGPLEIPVNVEETAASASASASAAAAAAANADVEADEDVEEPEPEEDELPEGWMELRTAEGKVYYQNGITRTTQWNRPEPPEPPTPKAADTAKQMKTATYNSTPSPLIGGAAAEQGWEKVMTVDGRPYFQNTITKMTSWHQPEGWEEPGAALPATDAETAVPAAKGSFFKSGGTVVDVKGLGVEATTASEVAAVAPTPIGRMAAGAPAASSARETDLPLAEGEEAPLPPGWEKLFTEDGVPFWTNHNERTTSWDPPTPLPAAATAAAAASSAAVVSEAKGVRQSAIGDTEVFESVDGVAEAAAIGVPVGSKMPRNMGADGRPLPEGWEMQTTDQGVPYYVDHINKRTSWDPPLMSSGGMSVIASELPDIPPAELVPDSADLYMGADLLNRFFCSWRGDTQGKSPLEAARNVIVTYLTGPGLKITKGRNGTNLQRYLYLSPTNKQVVWATKATPKGTLSKKGLTLDAITELHSEAGGIRVEARGESTPLILKSAAVETLTSEGATILLGVLLADMTGTMLRLQGVNGGSGSCYYPASFVNEVLTVRRVRTEKNAALAAAAAAASASHQAKPTPAPSIANKGSGGANGPAAAQASKLSIVSAAPATGSVAAAVASFSSPKHQQQRKPYQHGRSREAPVAANGNGASHAAAAAVAHAKPDPAPAVSPSPAPRVGAAAALTKAPTEASTSAKPSSVASEWRAAERAVTSGSTKSKGAGVAASYMAHLSKGSQKSLKPATAAAPASSSQADDAGSSGGGGAQEEAPASAPGPAAAAAAVAREEESSFSAASPSFGAKPEIAVSGGDESSDSPVQKNNTVFAAKPEGEADEGAPSSAAAAARAPAVGSTLPEEEAPAVAAVAAAAAVDEPKEEEAVAEAAQAPDEPEEDGEGEDEETREYRRVLTEMLRPAKMEKYVDSFLGSGITLDILPLVERADLHSEVGIEGAVPQLKIMKAIKTRFPHGV